MTKAKFRCAKSPAPPCSCWAKKDQMTQPKAAQSLIKLAHDGHVAMVNAGHQLMVEAPEETLSAMIAFCKK